VTFWGDAKKLQRAKAKSQKKDISNRVIKHHPSATIEF